jgi:hypothetical protein
MRDSCGDPPGLTTVGWAIRKPGLPMCWPGLQSIPLIGLMNSYRGTGDLFRYPPVRQPDVGCHLISHVFTIKYVAEKLGEDQEWLWDLQIDMDPEDGCLWVYGVGEDGVPAFTAHGTECLEQIIADERAAGKAPPKAQSTR